MVTLYVCISRKRFLEPPRKVIASNRKINLVEQNAHLGRHSQAAFRTAGERIGSFRANETIDPLAADRGHVRRRIFHGTSRHVFIEQIGLDSYVSAANYLQYIRLGSIAFHVSPYWGNCSNGHLIVQLLRFIDTAVVD